MKYRPEIDGLRAIAVAVVVLFHAGLGFSGGFVGVDVFFVISGYLITGLIMRDLRDGSFSIIRFFEKRVRRILPALCLMVFVVLVAGWFLLLPSAYAELAKSAMWQVLLMANVFFWLHTGYFAGAAEEKPLLHTWSLAVEEQFYLVVPSLLLLCWSWSKHRKLAIASLIGGLAVFGLLVSAYGVAYHRSAAFYLLPFRAWELAVGAALACLPSRWFKIRKPLAEMVGVGGVLAVAASSAFFTKTTPFPGFAALLPCAGTAAIIWSTTQHETVVRRVLSLATVVFVGRISYSWYLWHWPFFAFASYWALQPLSTGAAALLVAGSFFVAVLSYWFVEQPFRRKKLLSGRRDLFVWAGVANVSLLIAAFLVLRTDGFPARFAPATLACISAVDEMEFVHEVTVDDVIKDKMPQLGSAGRPVSVVLWGDSHAMSMAPAVDDFLRSHRLAGRMATHSATPPLIGFSRASEWGLGQEAVPFGQAVLDYIAGSKVPNVILAANWIAQPGRPAEGEVGDLEEQLIVTIRALRDVGSQPYVFLSVPVHKARIPKVLLRAQLLGDDVARYLADPQDGWNGISGSGIEFVQRMEAEGAIVIDPRPAFLTEDGKSYIVELEGRPLVRDKHHLTPYGARRVLIPILEKHLGSALPSSGL